VSKKREKLQSVTCANSSQHTIDLRSTPFAPRSVENTCSQLNQFQSKSTMTAVNKKQLN